MNPSQTDYPLRIFMLSVLLGAACLPPCWTPPPSVTRWLRTPTSGSGPRPYNQLSGHQHGWSRPTRVR